MSADLLRNAVADQLQKEADETVNRSLNVSTSQSCEQIALQVAGYRGMALALGRAMEILNTEYKKLLEPEEQQKAPAKPKELY